jgi:hypothetical protein
MGEGRGEMKTIDLLRPKELLARIMTIDHVRNRKSFERISQPSFGEGCFRVIMLSGKD